MTKNPVIWLQNSCPTFVLVQHRTKSGNIYDNLMAINEPIRFLLEARYFLGRARRSARAANVVEHPPVRSGVRGAPASRYGAVIGILEHAAPEAGVPTSRSASRQSLRCSWLLILVAVALWHTSIMAAPQSDWARPGFGGKLKYK